MENRITDLEVKLSFMEDTVDDLNRTIFRQQQQIELLARQLNDLRDQVQNASMRHELTSLRDEIPPHY